MMAAEEMEADWSLVRVKEAPALDEYANGYIVRALAGDYVPAALGRGVRLRHLPSWRAWFGLQVTGGSTAVRSTGEYGMRVAGAAAKEMLIAAAAQQFGVRAAECHGEELARHARGVGTQRRPSASSPRGRDAAGADQPGAQEPGQLHASGAPSPPRLDIPSKVDGSAKYGIDFTMPGMLYAAVEIAPVYGGKLHVGGHARRPKRCRA